PERFSTTLFQAPGMKATGIVIPDEVVTALGGSKKPAVTISIGDYSYRTTLGSMYGKSMAPFAAEHRAASGLVAGDPIDVTIEIDTAPRTVELPQDLANAITAAPGAMATFDALAPSQRKAHVVAVESAKGADTRTRRIAKVVEALTG
ncbi:MAG: hypothetical protein JWO10_1851, partial [Microbacteriaceae bacterium]|nr:hypothetical protein [Microbacteriaceae bacterium]